MTTMTTEIIIDQDRAHALLAAEEALLPYLPEGGLPGAQALFDLFGLAHLLLEPEKEEIPPPSGSRPVSGSGVPITGRRGAARASEGPHLAALAARNRARAEEKIIAHLLERLDTAVDVFEHRLERGKVETSFTIFIDFPGWARREPSSYWKARLVGARGIDWFCERGIEIEVRYDGTFSVYLKVGLLPID